MIKAETLHGIIDLCLGTNEKGEKEFLYICVRPELYDTYYEYIVNNDAFEPEDFGTIILRGKGSPSTETKALLEKEYGLWNGLEERLQMITEEVY